MDKNAAFSYNEHKERLRDMKQDTFCSLCPRKCKTDRKENTGFCGATEKVLLAKVMLHQWEEPCICYGAGSGALFFSGCQLKCAFCQNHEISFQITGNAVTKEDLLKIFFELEEKGACNINLVSPTPHLWALIPVLEKAKAKGLKIPIVLNSGGYESAEVIKKLEGLIDIYLPDFKFFDPKLSQKLAAAKDYQEYCTSSLQEMYRQTGKPLWDGEKLKKGLMIRHLILPGHTDDSINILKEIRKHFEKDCVILSLLRQYIPCHKANDFPELQRCLTSLEYQKVLNAAEEMGFDYLYTQKKESASSDFIPDFSQQ